MRRRAPSLPLRALHTRPLMLSAAFFGFGALLARDGRLPQGVLLVCAAVLLLAWCLLHLRSRRCAALLVACALFLGAARMGAAVATRPVLEDQFSIVIAGTVADTPSVDAEIGRLTCRLTDVRVVDETPDFDIRLYLRGNVSALRDIAPGQRVTFTGPLVGAGRGHPNPGQFDFAAYLWRNGVAAYATAELEDAVISGEARGLEALAVQLANGPSANASTRSSRAAPTWYGALVLGDRGDMAKICARASTAPALRMCCPSPACTSPCWPWR